MPAIVSKSFLAVLGATVLGVALSMFRYPSGPSISAEGIVGDWCSVSRVPALLDQLRDPFVGLDPAWRLARRGDDENLLNATRWRILPPLVAHLLGLSPFVFLALPMLGSCLLTAVTARYVWLATGDFRIVVGAALLTATSSAFFVSADWIQFDAYYLIALLFVAFDPQSIIVWAACSLGPWVDERFLLALPACVFLRAAVFGRFSIMLPLLGIAPYLAVRLLAAWLGDTSLVFQFRLQDILLPTYLPRIPLGWWMGFRAAWLLVAMGIGAAWCALSARTRVPYGLALAAALAAVVFLACDLSRSIALLLPFLVFGASVRIRRLAGGRLIAALAAMAILNLALPASHVLLKASIPVGQWIYRVHLPPPGK